MVIAKTAERLSLDTVDCHLDMIADRIEILVDTGKLESQGNLASWRQSEIRLPHLTASD
jgi:hypothetical protein